MLDVLLKMRTPIIILCLALITVSAISITVRDVFFVRALTLIILITFSAVGIFCFRRSDKASTIRNTILVGTLILLLIGFTNAPLRITFALFEQEFDDLSEQLVKGEKPDFPVWIGPFRIIDGGFREGTTDPYLMTSGNSYEINGFVRDPRGTYFNTWSITQVSEYWAYIEED